MNARGGKGGDRQSVEENRIVIYSILFQRLVVLILVSASGACLNSKLPKHQAMKTKHSQPNQREFIFSFMYIHHSQ